MSNSPLVSYTRIAKHYAKGRRFKGTTYTVDRITPHCVVGLWTGKQIADYFATTDRYSSPNYGIGKDGDISLCVSESDRSFCSSNGVNDAQSVTIECASDTTSPYRFPDATYKALLDLCTDICKRHGKKKLLWLGTKEKTLNYKPKPDEMVLSVHNFFANKACPGPWAMSHMAEIATTVTARLNEELKPKEEIDMTKDEVQKMIDESVNRALQGKNTEVSTWAKEDYGEAISLGFTDGSRPGGYAKREEVMVMLIRLLKKIGGMKE